MNLLDLTAKQLKRAASIRQQIDDLNKELAGLLGLNSTTTAAPKKNGALSASGRRKIAAAQKARWAKLRGSKSTRSSARRSPGRKKRTMSAAARARLSAKLKAHWAAKKAGKK
ncbi:MAG TPA: hypothetical protein VFV82_00505 [Candidatus Binatia bacterium]|nr:hypothetical protein [Candidatus Binatia bacterium]